MTFEDKIIAYLEGSLDEESSAELLHTLSVNPEKRMVLDEHLRLKDILVLGQRPLLVPQQAERALANILPILAEPSEISMAPAVARWTSVASGSAGVLTRLRLALTMRPVVTAFSVAALLASSSTFWYSNLFGPNASDVTHASATRNGVQDRVSTNKQLAERASSTANGSVMNADQSNTQSSHAPLSALHVSDFRHLSPEVDEHSSQNVRNTRDHAGHSNVQRPRIIDGLTYSDALVAGSPTEHSLQSNAVGAEHVLPASADLVASASDSLGEIPQAAFRASHIEPSGKHDHTLTEIAAPLGQDPTGRVLLGVSLSAYQFPSSTITGATQSSLLPEVSISYEVSDHIAIGASGGMTAVSTNTTAPAEQPTNKVNLEGYSQVVYTTTTELLNAGWAGLNVRYTINPFDPYAIHMELLGGAAYHTVFTPTMSLGAGFTHVLVDRVQLDAGILATGSWNRESAQSSYQGTASAVGIRHEDAVVTNRFTPSLGMRVAIRYSL